ncbi:MAG: SUMF1/EgtB/PvdO family nonheme iron enzyme [Treponema sp.]|nr:SUMF1/EgtB/PvdO family nonheme iron enzyme [Treponema sp.]
MKVIDISVSNPPEAGEGWIYKDNVYTVFTRADITVTGKNKGNRRIVVQEDAVNVKLTLKNLNLETTEKIALEIGDCAHVWLTLDGDNTLAPKGHCIYGRNKSKITIDGGGSLKANGWLAGGIYAHELTINGGKITVSAVHNGIVIDLRYMTINGGELSVAGRKAEGYGLQSSAMSGYTLVINGGTVTAESNSSVISFQDIVINGGTVKATALKDSASAAIGGAGPRAAEHGPVITINGGTVTAVCIPKKRGAGIGSTMDHAYCGILVMNGNAVVHASSLEHYAKKRAVKTNIDGVKSGVLYEGENCVFNNPGQAPQIPPREISPDSYEGYALSDGFEMIKVQPGTFTMGCECKAEKCGCSNDERPAHRVTLTDEFLIGVYPVTRAQWKEIMGELTQPPAPSGDDLTPIDCVSWLQVMEFIAKLNQKTGKSYRLPTEAEWEFAARGGIKSKGFKYSGSNDIAEVYWGGSLGFKKTNIPSPIGLMKPNELGIHDMTGILLEWVYDSHDDYTAEPKINPVRAADRSSVMRGIMNTINTKNANNTVSSRNNNRHNEQKDSNKCGFGFRLCLSAPDGAIAQAIKKAEAELE